MQYNSYKNMVRFSDEKMIKIFGESLTKKDKLIWKIVEEILDDVLLSSELKYAFLTGVMYMSHFMLKDLCKECGFDIYSLIHGSIKRLDNPLSYEK